MKDNELCHSCRKYLNGEHGKNVYCAVLRTEAHAVNVKVRLCEEYENAAEIEVEDDGTQRCNICGALWMGWEVCPNCGARFNDNSCAEVTHITTVEMTEIERGAKCEDNDDWKRVRAERIEAVMRRAFPNADDIHVAKVQEFVKEANDER